MRCPHADTATGCAVVCLGHGKEKARREGDQASATLSEGVWHYSPVGIPQEHNAGRSYPLTHKWNMNEYKIAVFRNGHSIAEYEIDADGVVEVLRSMHAAESKPVDSGTKEELPVRPTAKVTRTPKPVTARNKRGGCDECGSPSRHKKDCSRAGGAKKERSNMAGTPEWQALGEVESPTKRMSRMAFGRVKISQSHDIPAETIARNMDELPEEIEKALDAETYDEYLKL